MVYNNNLIDRFKDETLELKNATLEEALNKALEGKNLSFRVAGKAIIIEPKAEQTTIEKPFGLYQTVKGNVIDAESNTTIIGATVTIMESDPMIGTVTDLDGNYTLERVPIGRHNLQISYIGYEPTIVSEVLVTSGKEVFVNVRLSPSVTELDGITIKANVQKEKPLNTMAFVSARSFTVEESQRYAGGVGDPTRMASVFAGVAPGDHLDGNSISVRGHRPGAIVWRLEGVEIPNPNHFPGVYTAGAGFACLVSNQLMANSDFYTGAFPAEIGNSLSAALDLNLRTGNADKREYTFQVGVLGLDFATEGPFVKGKQASYNINYRYSTLGLLGDLHIIPKGFLPRYQDLTYKFNFPTKEAGTFSFWGTGGIDYVIEESVKDTSLWKYDWQQTGEEVSLRTGASGVSHLISIKQKTYIKTSVVGSITTGAGTDNYTDSNLQTFQVGKLESNTYTFTLSSFINHKFSPQNSNRTGFNLHNIHSKIDLYGTYDNDPSTWYNFTKTNSASYLMQFYTQEKLRLGERLIMNVGLHSQLFMLNQKYVIEPRIGVNYEVAEGHVLSAGYGKHSQLEELRYYYIVDPVSGEYLNKDLDFAKAHHFIIGYDWRINDFTRLKAETYYQKLYDYPGIADSSYSLINLEQDWELMADLDNVSEGINYGIDVTLERFLHNNYYFLVTGSLFKSSYTGGDGVTRNTRFDKGYTSNFLIGKEYLIGKTKNNIFSVSTRVNLFGGNRTTPIDWAKSENATETVEDYNRLFESKDPYRCFVDVTLRYRINKPKYVSTWSLEILNLIPLMSNRTFYSYNNRTEEYELYTENQPIIPFVSYKIEF